MPTFPYSATAVGGRDGFVRSASGSYEHVTVLAGSRAPGVTPEELIAGAWAACFGTTFFYSAREHEIDASEAVCHATVVFDADHDAGEYSIARATLEVYVPGVEPELLEPVLDATHRKCPVSKLLTSGVPELLLTPSSAPIENPRAEVSSASGSATDNR